MRSPLNRPAKLWLGLRDAIPDDVTVIGCTEREGGREITISYFRVFFPPAIMADLSIRKSKGYLATRLFQRLLALLIICFLKVHFSEAPGY